MLDIENKNIFIDFDGVICDSNEIKKGNIEAAAALYVDKKTARAFREYFIANNGLPRDLKTKEFFKEDMQVPTEKILEEYTKLNVNLLDAPLNTGLIRFLKKNSNDTVYILSGGSREEIEEYLEKQGIRDYFYEILSAPTTKIEHLKNIERRPHDFFIGDSRYDCLAATGSGVNFIFMKGLTQEAPPFKFLSTDDQVVENFIDLL
jgi:phosphoglycolate phosphatase-like HAD superfamily hydrolase